MNVPLDRTIALLPRPVSTSREASAACHLHVQTTTGESRTRKYDPLIFYPIIFIEQITYGLNQ